MPSAHKHTHIHTQDSYTEVHKSHFYECSANILTHWDETVVLIVFFSLCVCVCVCAGFLILCLSHSLVEILLSIFSCPKNTQQWHHFVFIGWGVYEVAVGVKGSKGRKEVGVPTVTVQTRVWWASLTARTGTSKWPTICRQSGEPFHWDLSPMLWLLLEWHTSTPEKLLVVRASAFFLSCHCQQSRLTFTTTRLKTQAGTYILPAVTGSFPLFKRWRNILFCPLKRGSQKRKCINML